MERSTTDDDGHQKKTIVVFGAGRSGTTWLAEAISAAGLELVFEPLNAQEVPECRDWQPLPLFYRRTDDFPWQDVFARMLRGEVRNRWTARGDQRGERKVVKLIRANLMIDWILEHFDIHPVFIIRNPLSVVASWRQQGWNASPDRVKGLLADRRFSPLFDGISGLQAAVERGLTTAEANAIMWSILNYVPKRLGVFDRVRVVVFDELCRDPEGVMSALAQRIEIQMTDEVRDRLRRPSTMSGPQSADVGYDPTVAWKEVLTPEEADAVASIVSSFGLEGFIDR